MGLPIRIETRTGDTPTSKRQRQRRDPPDILLTTPEQLALLLATADAPYLFGIAQARGARRTARAGHVEARRSALARPGAAVARSRRGLASDRPLGDGGRARRPAPLPGAAAGGRRRAAPISSSPTAAPQPDVTMLDTARASALGRPFGAPRASREIYELIKQHKMTLVFVNTRSQAEMIFQAALAHQRRQPRHRAASRLARCRRSAARSRTR